MPKETKDHYIPIAYLNQFTDPNQRVRLHVYRKQDQIHRLQIPKKVCREGGGDENPFYSDPTILRSLLVHLEPRLATSIRQFIEDPIRIDDRFNIALFIAYLMIWVPAVRRTMTDMLEQNMEAGRPFFAKHAEKKIVDPEEAKKTVEALLNKNILFRVDPHYPRAIGLRKLVLIAANLYKGSWILSRAPEDKHFITSDNPVVDLFQSDTSEFGVKFFALNPKWIVMIVPERSRTLNEDNLDKIEPGAISLGEMKSKTYQDVTELMVKCAERTVISSREDESVHELVKLYSDWRMEVRTEKLPWGESILQRFKLRPVSRNSSS